MKNLLVTLADENYINQVKQLFSSVYFNSGWKGDYMLLAHEIPEKKVKWFKDKGILIKKCKPIYNKKDSAISSTHLSKFYLFTSEFRKWKNVIYLDGDIIVRASLDDLTNIKGFTAVQNYCFPKLSHQFRKNKLKKIKKNYFLKSPAFNTGVMAFSTDIIKNDSFSRLKRVFEIYNDFSATQEQSLLNLFFYKKWKKLPRVYNITPYYMNKNYNIELNKINGLILHFPGPKPWNSKDIFYKEWKNNLLKAKKIDLNKIQNSVKKWNKKEIKKYCLYLKIKDIIYPLDRFIGRIGIFLKNNFPVLYYKLKNSTK